MTVEQYLLHCAELGIDRGALAEEHKFTPDGRLITSKEPAYLSDDHHKYRPPPLTEDLSHLNPTRRRARNFSMRQWIDGLSPEDKARKLAQIAAAGTLGGKAKKNKAHGKYR